MLFYILPRLLATTSADMTTRIWKTVDFTQVMELKDNNQRWVWDCAFTVDSQYIITGNSVDSQYIFIGNAHSQLLTLSHVIQ